MSEKNVTETSEQRGDRKTREGLVVSDKMDKTVVVAVEDRKKHALYGKVIRRSTKLKAHDEQNAAGIGDRVLLMETRPLSATKHWRVVEILEKAK
jgi:small subunit ribosomal protein S17